MVGQQSCTPPTLLRGNSTALADTCGPAVQPVLVARWIEPRVLNPLPRPGAPSAIARVLPLSVAVSRADDVCEYNSGNQDRPLCCLPGDTPCFGAFGGGACCRPGTVCEGSNTDSAACGALSPGNPDPDPDPDPEINPTPNTKTAPWQRLGPLTAPVQSDRAVGLLLAAALALLVLPYHVHAHWCRGIIMSNSILYVQCRPFKADSQPPMTRLQLAISQLPLGDTVGMSSTNSLCHPALHQQLVCVKDQGGL